MKKILVRVDFQNDFVNQKGALTINAPELIKKHQTFASQLTRKMFDEIIDTYDTHFDQTYPLTFESKSYPAHCIFGTWGWQHAAPLPKDLPHTPIYKSTTNLWNEMAQYPFLSENFNQTHIFLCGVLSEVCVKQALDGFLERGATVTLIEDLCQGLNEQIKDLIRHTYYRPYLQSGKLHSIQSRELFKERNKK